VGAYVPRATFFCVRSLFAAGVKAQLSGIFAR